MHKREDGIVDLDKSRCIGCQYCVWVCPYNVPQFDPEAGVSDKCNMCAQRLDQGEEPMCVLCCPSRAIKFGDLNDPDSEVAKMVNQRSSKVLLPEQGTSPTTQYLF
jgi:Fe-S-cluster-containing dehydrogenase component